VSSAPGLLQWPKEIGYFLRRYAKRLAATPGEHPANVVEDLYDIRKVDDSVRLIVGQETFNRRFDNPASLAFAVAAMTANIPQLQQKLRVYMALVYQPTFF
jgi:hypothetical protein